MFSATANYLYILSGDATEYDNPTHELKLFDIMPGDVVNITWEMVETYEKGHTGIPVEGMPRIYFDVGMSPQEFVDMWGMSGFGVANWAVLDDTPTSTTNLILFSGTTTFASDFTWSTQVTVGQQDGESTSGSWGLGEALYLNVWDCYHEFFTTAQRNYAPDILGIHVTLTNADRSETKVLPSQFTPEQRAKFLADAQTIDKLTDGMTTLGSGIDPTSVPLAGLNWLVDQATQAFNPQMGTPSATAKTMPEVLLTAGILSENLPEVGPIAFTVGLASIFTTRASDLLKALANDPPEINYGQVLDFPQEAFTPIAGIGSSGNALLEALYKMVGDLTEMLAAAERFQGADFAGSDSDKAAQEAAFNTALSAYNARRETVADALTTFLTEAALPDVNFEDSTSTSLAATYFQGLSSITADPILNEFVTGLIDTFLPSSQPAQLLQAIQTAFADPDIGPQLSEFAPFLLLGDFISDIEVAIANAQPSPFSGSVLSALDDVVASLATKPPPSTNADPQITSDGGGDTASKNVAENTTLVTTLAASDSDSGQTLTFTIDTGEDAGLFEIRNGNQLHFKTAPDFANRPAAGATPGYQVTVQVSDGNGGTDAQEITVTLTDANDSGAGGVNIDSYATTRAKAMLLATNDITDPDIVASDISYQWRSSDDGANWTDIAGAIAASFTPGGEQVGRLIQVVASYTDTSGTHSFTSPETAVVGDKNDNTLNGSAGRDIVLGLSGTDTLAGLGGADTLDGGKAKDTASYSASSTGVTVNLLTGLGSGGDAEGDTLLNIENLLGSTFGDTLSGNALANRIDGDAGDDVIEGGAGKDNLIGGTHGVGGDTVSYANAPKGVTVNLAATRAQNTRGAGRDTLSGFENVTGSAFGDKLTGTSDNNIITGLAGNDRMSGGEGADAFAFTFATDGLDTITDFVSGEDFFQISAAGFGGGLVAGATPTLLTGADVVDADGGGNSFFFLDTEGKNAGTVFWDASGGPGSDAVAFARITGTALVPSDFHLV